MHSTHLLMKGVKDTMDLANFFNPFQVRKKLMKKNNSKFKWHFKTIPSGLLTQSRSPSWTWWNTEQQLYIYFPPVFIMATARNTEFGKKKVHTSPPLVTMQENEKARPSRLSGAPNVVQSCQLVKVVDCAEWLCACAPQLSDPCECGIQARPPNG